MRERQGARWWRRSGSGRGPVDGPGAPDAAVGEAGGAEAGDGGYEPPVVLDLGRVREVTLGSSSSGRADANSQYYW